MELNRYRKDYPGEFIVTSVQIVNRRRTYSKEFIENPIKNQHISGRSCILGSDSSLFDFPIKLLQGHRGGLLGAKGLQSYACDQVKDHMIPNFTYCNDKEMLQHMVDTKYTEQSVCYTRVRNVLAHPGEFYIVPYQISMLPEATLAWLASFDGHKEVFFLGLADSNPKVIHQVKTVMEAFPEVTYTRVFYNGFPNETKDHNCPESWKWCHNFKQMNKLEWISYCDIS